MAAARDTAEGCQKAVAHRRLVKKPRLKHPAYPGTVLSTQTLATLHKLKASQIELELQNAELRRAHAELAASHARYADLFDLAPVGYLVLNAEGLIQQTNAVAAQLLGVERSQVLGQPMIRFVFQSDRHTYDLHRNQLANSTQLAEACELRLQRPDGSLCWVHVQSALAQGSDRGQGCRVTLNDITERKLVDQALANSEPRIRTILQALLDGFWLLDLQGRFLDVNDAYRAMSGYSRGELLQMRVADVEAVETEQDIAAHIALIASQGQERFETRHRCKDGRVMDIDCSVNYLDIDGGRLVCFCRDITERKRSEAALRASEAKLRALFGAMTDVIFILDGDGRYLEVAPSNPVYLVHPDTELLGRTMHEVLPATQADLILRQIRRALDTQQPTTVDYDLDFGGATHWFAARISPLSANTVLMVARNITERKEAEEALRQSETQYRTLIEHAPVGICKSNSADRVLFVNPAFARILGYDSPEQFVTCANAAGVAKTLYWDPDERPRVIQQTLRSGEWQQFETHYRRRDGSEVCCHERLAARVESNGKTYLTGFVEDITERKQAKNALRDSEERLRAIVMDAPIGIATSGADHCFINANDAFCRVLGYTEDELQRLTFRDITHPADLTASTSAMEDLSTGKVALFSQEKRYITKAGNMIVGKVMVSALRDPDRKPRLFVAELEDITERKRAEEALRQSEDKFAKVFRHSPDAIAIIRLSDGFVIEINDGFAAQSGYTAADVQGKTLLELGLWADLTDRARFAEELREHGEFVNLEASFRAKDGRSRTCLVSASTILVGGEACVVSVTRDITERKQLEGEKDIMVQLLHLLNAKNDPEGMLRKVLDLLQRWSGCNAVAIRLRKGDDYPYFETSGFPAAFVKKEASLCARDLTGQWLRGRTVNPGLECLCGKILCGRFDPAQPFFTSHGSFWTNSATRLLASTTEADRQVLTSNRCTAEGFESVALIPLRAGGITYGLLQLHDHRQGRFTPRLITLLEQLGDSLAIALAQYEAQEALQASEERLRMALAASNQGIFELDLQTGKATISEEYAHLMGHETGVFLASDWLDRVHPDDRERVERIVHEATAGGSEGGSTEYRWRTQSGEWKWILACGNIVARDQAGRPLRLLGTHMDISERKRTAEALRLAQKTESLGVLAGGVAHDFNNLLVAMLGQTSLALAKLPPESTARGPIEKAVSAAHRAADLTRQLLAYSGRGHFSVQPLNLNVLIDENLRLLEVAIPKHVRLAAELADRLPLIQADAGQIQQVLMNLIINAAEAIGSRSGTVTVRTGVSEVTPTDRDTWRHTGEPLPTGRYVVLQVSDNGCGMDDETLARIFDPFFSTKFTGRGLGLAAALGIVSGHHGGLRVESTPGAGTTFQLVFPAVAHDETQPVRALLAPSAAIPSQRTSDLILLIDDEEPVREAVTDILERQELRVLSAPNGKAGLDLYREHQAEIGLVLLDLSMPGLSGEETFRQLRAINPQVHIVLSSGYDESEVAARFAGQSLTGFVQKPYSAGALTAAIRQHLKAD
jgi:PAS domain S-box-containing protein